MIDIEVVKVTDYINVFRLCMAHVIYNFLVWIKILFKYSKIIPIQIGPYDVVRRRDEII